MSPRWLRHDAFRAPGDAARIDQMHDVVGRRFRQILKRASGEESLVVQRPVRSILADADVGFDVRQLILKLRDGGRILLFEDQDAWRGIGQDVFDLWCGEAKVDGGGDIPRQFAGAEDLHELHAVLRQDREPILRAQADPVEGRCQALRAVVMLAEADAPVAVNIGDLLRKLVGVVAKDIAQRFNHDVSTPLRRPVRLLASPYGWRYCSFE